MSGILSIENDEADLGKKSNQFINDKNDFNNKHIIKCNIQPISNIMEEPCFVLLAQMIYAGFYKKKKKC